MLGLGAALAGLCLPSGAASAPARGVGLATSDLAGGAFLVSGAGGNVTVLAGPSGCVVIDTGSRDRARDLTRLLRERCGKAPPLWAINTHWHPDHTGGNEALRRGGTPILAHENTRLWMGAPIASRWNGERFEPRPREAWPTKTFYATEVLEALGERIECGYLLQGHTDGDIYVRLSKANVLVTGGVFTVGEYPVPDPATLGWIGGLTSCTEQLLKLCDAQTLVVPGTGPVQHRPALEAQLQMLTTVRDRLYALLREGRSVEEMLAARPTAEFDGRWGDPEKFIRAAFAGMAAHVRQIPGIV
jgi:glyoxylase-like metal-dependent hydrolase (beta-lactamase superfamily II)